MALPNTRQAYADCYEAFERALADPVGIRFATASHEQAVYTRMRLHKARMLDRIDNAKAYPDGHPMHGASVYDPFTIQIMSHAGVMFLYIRRQNLGKGFTEAESLAEIDPDTIIPDAEPVALADIVDYIPLRRL